jgi:hypothetical protein
MSLRRAPLAHATRDPLAGALARLLPRPALLLELGSGTGEHAVHAAARLPWLTWQPSDPDPAARASIAARAAQAALPNVLPPLDLDLLARAWTLRRADALLLVHVLHLAPAPADAALLAGAAAVLGTDGLLLVVGPFRRGAAPPAGRLAGMDAALRAGTRPGGLPDLDALAAAAGSHDLALQEVSPFPGEEASRVPGEALLGAFRKVR